jgi:hypothetical protein
LLVEGVSHPMPSRMARMFGGLSDWWTAFLLTLSE